MPLTLGRTSSRFPVRLQDLLLLQLHLTSTLFGSSIARLVSTKAIANGAVYQPGRQRHNTADSTSKDVGPVPGVTQARQFAYPRWLRVSRFVGPAACCLLRVGLHREPVAALFFLLPSLLLLALPANTKSTWLLEVPFCPLRRDSP